MPWATKLRAHDLGRRSIRIETQVRQIIEQAIQHCFHLCFRDLHTQTQMRTTAKAEVNLGWPVNIELIGVIANVFVPIGGPGRQRNRGPRSSEEHTSQLQSLMRISYAVLCSQQTRIPPHLSSSTLQNN